MAGVKGRSGGARFGCTKPRQVGSLRWQREQRKSRTELPAAPVAPLAAVAAPLEMPAEERAVWDRLAPRALAARTLTLETADAFADLCEAIVLKRTLLAQIRRDGYTHLKVTVDGAGQEHQELKAHPLLAKFQAHMVRVEAGMARFLLTATGKPAPALEPPKDEWAEFDGLNVVRGGKA